MTLCSTIFGGLSRRLALGVVCIAATASVSQAQFRSQEDRDIVKDILRFFGRECTLRSANENDIVKRLEIEADRSRRQKDSDVEKCFTKNYSQITGVFYLYQKICADVSSNTKNPSDIRMAKQILEINKYQTGTRPYHAALNECLVSIPEHRGKSYIVALPGAELDTSALQFQIDRMKSVASFPATTEPFR